MTTTLPERDPSKPAEAQGLFNKFDVRRVDGSDQPGGKHDGCEYFVLDLTHDAHAPAAMRAYAEACASTHPQLANDLRERFGSAPETGDLHIGISAHTEGGALSIMRPNIDGSTTVIYTGLFPLGDSYARASLNPPIKPPAAPIERRRELRHAALPRDAECALEHAAIKLDKAGEKEAHQHITSVLRDHLPAARAESGMEVGALAIRKDGGMMRSGAQAYAGGVVAQVEPFILISEGADMLWSATVKREDFVPIGTADEDTMKRVNARLASHLQDKQITFPEASNEWGKIDPKSLPGGE